MEKRTKLTDDLHIPAPFDLIFCGRRETMKEHGHIELRGSDVAPPLLAHKSLRFYVGDRLTHKGSVLGDDEFGRVTKSETGAFEVWLDPRFVSPVA